MGAYPLVRQRQPAHDRLALCKAYIAKAVWDFATPIHAREKAEAKPKLRPKPTRGRRRWALLNALQPTPWP